MKKSCRAGLLGLGAFLLAASAQADDDGAYVFVSAGRSMATNACQSAYLPYFASLGGTGSCSEKSYAFRAGLGYQFTPMWGLELNYGQFGYASSDGGANMPLPIGPGSYSWSLKATGLALQGTATLHMGDSFAVFGKFGVARVQFNEYAYAWSTTLPPGYSNYYFTPVVNDAKTVPALGVGVQFDLTPHGSARLMVESFGKSDIYTSLYGPTPSVRLTSASLALMYRY